MNLYFRDNFFNAGMTEILNEREEYAGQLDLKSAFGSAVDVYGPEGQLLCSGGFQFLSGRWTVTAGNGATLGRLRSGFSFFSKKFIYETEARGSYEIVSPSFSREYEISGPAGVVARFTKVNGWFSSGAFLLENRGDDLDAYELVAVIMGVHAIQTRHRAARNAAT